jgi:kumamolisin
MLEIPKGYQRLEKSHRNPRRGAQRVGPADPKETLSVTIRVRRRPDAPALPNPMKSSRVISHEEFAARYSAAKADIDQVVAFAKGSGLTVVETNAPRRTVLVSGTVEQMNKAFGVELGRYQSPTETYRGREDVVQLPQNLSGIVEGVFGLDNRKMAQRAAAQPLPPPSESTTPLTPPQVAALYNFPTPFNATGQTIGLLEFGGGYQASDIQAFFNGLHITTPTLTAVGIDGASNSPGSSDDVEVALDIDVAGSVAPGSQIAVYFAPWTEQGWIDAVTSAVHPSAGQPTPSVLSISWGWPELEAYGAISWTQAAIDAVSATFEEAAALGITVFAASGDHGSSCGLGDKKAHVIYPGSDPWITSCGGTVLENVSGAAFTQGTWNDNNGWATGGGISDIFVPPPQWQSTVKLPSSVNDGHQGRGIPDVAGNADSASGYNLIVGGNGTGAVGGTSAVAPLYAGLAALLNAKLGAPVGFLNATLYNLPGICQGVSDNVSNATNAAPGYSAVAGWNACTGLGSINGSALMTALAGLASNTSRVATAAQSGGNLQVIYLWSDDLAYLVWQDTGGTWHPFGALPNPRNIPFASLATGIGNNGQVQVVCLGRDDGQPYLIWQDTAGNWSNYGALPNPTKTPFSAVAAGTGNKGQLQLVCIGKNDGQPYLIYQDTAGNWNNYGALPNPTHTQFSSVATGIGNNGQLQVLCIGRSDGQLYLLWQDTAGNWNNSGALPNPAHTSFSAVATGIGNNGQLQVICLGENDGLPYLYWQDAKGNWTNYGALPNPSRTAFSSLSTGIGSNKQLQVICIGRSDGQPYLIWQDTKGNWANYGALPNINRSPAGSASPTPFGSVATGTGNGGQLQVLCSGEDDNHPYLIWQDQAGAWHGYGPGPLA